jgi:selenide,water dikinase
MVASMCRPNAEAAAVALDAGATGATDVTGFGLLGHLAQMARASSVDVTLDAAAVPLLPHTRDLTAAGHVPGGSRRNLDWVRDRLDTGPVDEVTLTLLADAQTSGGLLFGLARRPPTPSRDCAPPATTAPSSDTPSAVAG